METMKQFRRPRDRRFKHEHIMTSNHSNSQRLEMRNISAELFPRKKVKGAFVWLDVKPVFLSQTHLLLKCSPNIFHPPP